MGIWDSYKNIEMAPFNMFKDPSKDTGKYLDQIPGRTSQYMNPYIEQGQRAGSNLEGQYGNLTSDPGAMVNKIGSGYQESPGFKFALERALAGGGRAAAAGGMAGSPTHEFENMQTASGLASQDYDKYLSHALDQYGLGLKGEEGMNERGYGASKEMSDMIAQVLAGQAGLKYAGQSSQNNMLSNLFQTAGKFGTAMLGG